MAVLNVCVGSASFLVPFKEAPANLFLLCYYGLVRTYA